MEFIHGPGVRVPKLGGWQDRSQLIMVAPDSSSATFRPNIVVVRELQNERPKEVFLAEHMATLEDTFDRLEIKAAEERLFGSNQGILIEYTFEAGSQVYGQGQFVMPVAEFFYTVTYSDVENNFDRSRIFAHQIIEGLEIIGNPSAA